VLRGRELRIGNSVRYFSKYETVFNLKTAKMFGVALTILALADEVIEIGAFVAAPVLAQSSG
jgi:hypothetical protein